MGSIVIDDNYEKCRKLLKDSISNRRYLHSIGVSNTSACLAMNYGCDLYKAYIAGLLHDCAKGLKDHELIEECDKAGIKISDVEYDNPELLHAKAGSVVAKKCYGIDDEEILGAIMYHTTGKPGMTLLEKIVFVADYIEPNRAGLPMLTEARKTAFTDIDRCVCLLCSITLDHLTHSAKSIDPMTLKTYEYYKD